MIDANKLRGVMAEKGYTQDQVAQAAGMTRNTFRNKIALNKFYSDEMVAIGKFLALSKDEFNRIFFAGFGT